MCVCVCVCVCVINAYPFDKYVQFVHFYMSGSFLPTSGHILKIRQIYAVIIIYGLTQPLSACILLYCTVHCKRLDDDGYVEDKHGQSHNFTTRKHDRIRT